MYDIATGEIEFLTELESYPVRTPDRV
jgi:hypothetical protein